VVKRLSYVQDARYLKVNLTPDKEKLQAVVNSVKNFGVPQNAEG